MIRKVADNLYRGPRLVLEEYQKLVDLVGINLVVNLENDNDAIQKEDEICHKLDILVLHISMSKLLPCSLKKLQSIVDEIEQYRTHESKIYIHCRRGIDRTGQVIAAWQIRYGEKSFDDAYAEMISYGHPTLYNLLGWKFILSRVKRSS